MDKPWKVVFAFVGVFVAGAVFGGLLALRIGKSIVDHRREPLVLPPVPAKIVLSAAGQPGNPAKPPLPAAPQFQSAQLLRRFAERLDLSPEQRERIMPRIQRATADFRRQQQTHFREDTVVLQHLQEDIRRELTSDQRRKLDKMEERQKELLEQRKRADDALRAEQGLAPNQVLPGGNPAAARAAQPAPQGPAAKAPAPSGPNPK